MQILFMIVGIFLVLGVLSLLITEFDFKLTIISLALVLIIIVGVFLIMLPFIEVIENKDNINTYIQNLETKVNILTVDYEEFSLEDSLKQER